MRDDDIVAGLDRWLEMWPVSDDPMTIIRRARDEIDALRVQCAEMAVPVIDENSKLRDEILKLRNALHGAELSFVSARVDALEEAARVCEAFSIAAAPNAAMQLAAAIRALKDA